MGMNTKWIPYIVAAIYSTLLLGCLIGLKINNDKKKYLVMTGAYIKNSKVIKWKRRFYIFLFLATICRMSAIIGATVENKKLLLTKAESSTEFAWQIAAAFGSMLYFSAFSLIIWFFAQIAYYKQDSKQMITLIITIINVILYCSNILLGISDSITKEWDLIYDVQLPLFSVCNWILSIFFVFFSCKIANSIETEKKETVDYHIEHSHSGQVPQLKQNKYLNNPHSGPTGDTQYIVPRLVKLSILCASMWTIRGCYTAALRIWKSADMVPFSIEPLIWESMFYCITEYPPSLGALFLMILKPKRSRADSNNSAQQYQQYPKAIDYNQMFD